MAAAGIRSWVTDTGATPPTPAAGMADGGCLLLPAVIPEVVTDGYVPISFGDAICRCPESPATPRFETCACT